MLQQSLLLGSWTVKTSGNKVFPKNTVLQIIKNPDTQDIVAYCKAFPEPLVLNWDPATGKLHKEFEKKQQPYYMEIGAGRKAVKDKRFVLGTVIALDGRAESGGTGVFGADDDGSDHP